MQLYFKYKSNPNKSDSDDDSLKDNEDILPLKPFIKGKYNRDFSIYYANKYYDSYNPFYYWIVSYIN